MSNQPDHRDLAEDALEDYTRTGSVEFGQRAIAHGLLAIVDALADIASAIEDSNSVDVIDVDVIENEGDAL